MVSHQLKVAQLSVKNKKPSCTAFWEYTWKVSEHFKEVSITESNTTLHYCTLYFADGSNAHANFNKLKTDC